MRDRKRRSGEKPQPQDQELRVIRSIVTPLSREMAAAALPRRAAGGA